MMATLGLAPLREAPERDPVQLRVLPGAEQQRRGLRLTAWGVNFNKLSKIMSKFVGFIDMEERPWRAI